MDTPQPVFPPRWDTETGLALVEQGSPSDDTGRMEVIVRCPQGFVDSLPAFGVDLEGQVGQLNADPAKAVADAVNRWAPDIDGIVVRERSLSLSALVVTLRGEQ